VTRNLLASLIQCLLHFGEQSRTKLAEFIRLELQPTAFGRVAASDRGHELTVLRCQTPLAVIQLCKQRGDLGGLGQFVRSAM
jgi:hypothetical protein